MSRLIAMALACIGLSTLPVSAVSTDLFSLEGRFGEGVFYQYWGMGGFSGPTTVLALGIHPGDWVSIGLGYGFATTIPTDDDSEDIDGQYYHEASASAELHFLRREHVRLSMVGEFGMAFREYRVQNFSSPSGERFYWHNTPYLEIGLRPEYLFNANLGVFTTVGIKRQWSPETWVWNSLEPAPERGKNGYAMMMTYGGEIGMRIYF